MLIEGLSAALLACLKCAHTSTPTHPPTYFTYPPLAQPQTVKDEITVLVELPLLVREDQAELYKLSAEDAVEVGPFVVSSSSCCVL